MIDLAVLGCCAAFFVLPIVAFDRAARSPHPKRLRIKALVTVSMTVAVLLGFAAATADVYLHWLPAARALVIALLAVLARRQRLADRLGRGATSIGAKGLRDRAETSPEFRFG